MFHLVFYYTSIYYIYRDDVIIIYVACISAMKYRFAIEDPNCRWLDHVASQVIALGFPKV